MHRFELDRHYDEIEWNNIDSVLFISDAMRESFKRKENIKVKPLLHTTT